MLPLIENCVMNLVINCTKIEELDETLQKVLCFYVYCSDFVPTKTLEALWKTLPTMPHGMKKALDLLTSKGMLSIFNYDWTSKMYVYCVSYKYYFPVLYFLKTRHPEWEDDYRRCVGYDYNKNEMFLELEEAFMAVLEHREADLLPLRIPVSMYSYLFPVAFDPCISPLFLKLDDDLFAEAFSKLLVYMQDNDYLDDQNHLLQWLETKSLPAAMRSRLRSMLALYRYYSHGEYKPLQDSSDDVFFWILNAVYALHRERYADAVALFDKALKIRNKIAHEKNIFENPLTCYFLIMAYVHDDSPASIKRLDQFRNKRGVKEQLNLLPAYIVASAFRNEERKASLGLVQQLFDSLFHPSVLYSYLGFLFNRYFELTDPLQDKGFYELHPQQAVLKHELSAYIDLTEDERARLTQIYGTSPALTSIRRKQAWELLIEDLLKNESQTGSVQKEEKDARLMYLIKYNYIEVREQTRLKSGKWSSGKPISNIRYFQEGSALMDEFDRQIWNKYRQGNYDSMYLSVMLPMMVGCDRLYTGYYAPFEQVKVDEEKPYLSVEKVGNRFNITSNIPLSALLDTPDSHIVLKKSDTYYTVIPITPKQWDYYRRLLMVGYFPLEAEAQLKDFLPRISDTVEVHSSLLENGSTLETVEGSAEIALQVRPQGRQFEVKTYVKPLPKGKGAFLPGEGNALVFDEADGKRVQVKRHLGKERRNYEVLNNFMEDSFGRSLERQSISLLPEELLSLIDFVRQSSDTYYIEWPEGEKLRLKLPVSTENMHVRLETKGDWFDIEGEVQIDDHTVLSMTQLLDLLGQSHGNFIRLNETDYLKLNESLLKQLRKLEALTVKEHGQMHISRFNAPLLDDAMTDELEVQGNRLLDDLRASIRRSMKIEAGVPNTLQATLRGYQLEGFRWMVRLSGWGAGACLADDMGLGKTVQTIAFLLYRAAEGASLVVAPASVVPNWKNELQRFAPTLNVHVLNGADDRKALIDGAGEYDVVLSTYGLLVNAEEPLVSKQWNVVCLDEAHTIKNRDTKTSRVAMQLQASARLILTGTPIQNHLSELWNLFRFITPGLLGSYEQFRLKFIVPIEEGDKEKQRQLKRIVQPFMLRRTKSEVVEELPEKMEITLPVELSEEEMAVYEVIRRRAKAMLEESNAVSMSTLAEITRLRQAACSIALTDSRWKGETTKIQMLLDLIAEIKEGNNRVLVFSQFTSFLELVRKRLDEQGEPYFYLDGSVTMKQREELVRKFQQGECPIFLISLKAGGLGLNLTGANYVIHLDPWWNPAIEQQATDRAYRIGQQNRVTVYHLIAQHTIEEKILRLHRTKRDLADSLLEGANAGYKLTDKELLEMLTEQDG